MTLDHDVHAMLREVMREREIGFKQALNETLRAGLARGQHPRFVQRTFAMGFRPEIPYEKTLRLAAELENQELVRKAALGK